MSVHDHVTCTILTILIISIGIHLSIRDFHKHATNYCSANKRQYNLLFWCYVFSSVMKWLYLAPETRNLEVGLGFDFRRHSFTCSVVTFGAGKLVVSTGINRPAPTIQTSLFDMSARNKFNYCLFCSSVVSCMIAGGERNSTVEVEAKVWIIYKTPYVLNRTSQASGCIRHTAARFDPAVFCSRRPATY